MQKINFLIVILITQFISSQNVSINSILVNSQNISGTTINLGSNTNAYVTFVANVTLPTVPSDNYPGTIDVFYKKTSSSSEVMANGGFGGTLLFLGSTSATRSFTIELQASQFNTTGGFFYVKYKTYSGTVYTSSNIHIIKNSTSNGGGVPYNPTPINSYTEYVPYDGIPLLSMHKNPNIYPTTTDVFYWQNTYNYTEFNIFNRNNKKTTLQESHKLRQIGKNIDQNGNILYNIYSTPEEVISLIVRRPFPSVKRIFFNNVIEKDQYINYGNVGSTIIGNNAEYSADGTTIPLNNYQWQKRIVRRAPFYTSYVSYMNLYGWKDIPNANSKDFTPTENFTDVTEYRRLIFDIGNGNPYNKAAASSNVVTIYPTKTDPIDNIICCDQNSYSAGTLNAIIGTTTTLQPTSGIIYQWQIGSILNGSLVWSDIPYANQKDYTPIRPTGRFPNGLIKYYRRNAIDTNTIGFGFGDYDYYVSNTINITFFNTSSRISNNEIQDLNLSDRVKIYPNPTNSIINLSSNDKFIGKVSIIDLNGKTLFYRDFNNNNEASVDISDFSSGLYIIIIQKEDNFQKLKISKF